MTALGVCLLVAGAAFAVSACDSSDDSGRKVTFKKMELEFGYAVSDDLLKVADIKLTYVDPAGTGEEVVEELKATSWSKKFEATTLPASFSIAVTASLKSDFTFDKTSYALSCEATEIFREYGSDNKVHWSEGPDVDREEQVATTEAELTSFLTLLNRTYAYVVAVDEEDGGYDVTDND